MCNPGEAGLGGTEQAILGLTEALAARGHRVVVSGGAAEARHLGGVDWLAGADGPAPDICVAINDAALLPPVGLPIVWFHNEVGFLREWRKGRLGALWRRRPAAVFIGRVQAAAASRVLGFRSRATIPYGLPARVLAAEPATAIPGPHAVFTSQAYRGLDRVIAIWRARVSPLVPGARLSAFIAARDVGRYTALAAGDPSITIRPRLSNDAVLAMLREARVLIVPGHRSETFCLAAAEAIAMGVPVVTLGVGSLRERVADGRTGFVARNWGVLAERTRRLLTNDTLWAAQHSAGLATRLDAGWDRAAQSWETFVGEHLAAG